MLEKTQLSDSAVFFVLRFRSRMDEISPEGTDVQGSVEPPAKRVSPFAIPEPIQDLLGYGAVAYALGFLTITFNTGRYGVAVIEFTRPLNLWVGIIPTFGMIVVIKIWRGINLSSREARWILGAVIFCFLVLFAVVGWVVSSTTYEMRKITAASWFQNHQFLVSSITWGP